MSLLSLLFSLEFFSLFHCTLKRQINFTLFYILYFDIFSFSVSRGHKVTDHILFGTPGTMLDWMFRQKAVDPKKIKMFVLDEADVMIAIQGHQDQSIRIHK